MRGSWLRIVGVVGTLAMLSGAAAGAECALPLSDFQARGDEVGVLADASVDPGIVAEAVSLWQGCANYARSFPRFVDGVRAGRTVTVRAEARPRGVSRHVCGSFQGSSIILYRYWVDAAGAPHRCGSLAQNLAHELGHVLGLDDAPAGSACGATIMAPLTDSNRSSRQLSAEVCQLAGQKWLTPGEALVADALGDTEPYRFVNARLQ